MSFVLRIWLEDESRSRRVWRGRITHAASWQHGAVRTLDDSGIFIMPYLEQLGVQLDWCGRTRRWLKR